MPFHFGNLCLSQLLLADFSDTCGSSFLRIRMATYPWENGYCESFNGKLRDECLNGEIFYSRKEAQVVIEQWRVLSSAKTFDRLNVHESRCNGGRFLRRT